MMASNEPLPSDPWEPDKPLTPPPGWGERVQVLESPITPAPPSPDSTESLISYTLTQQPKHKHSADIIHGYPLLKLSEIMRRKSIDFGQGASSQVQQSVVEVNFDPSLYRERLKYSTGLCLDNGTVHGNSDHQFIKPLRTDSGKENMRPSGDRFKKEQAKQLTVKNSPEEVLPVYCNKNSINNNGKQKILHSRKTPQPSYISPLMNTTESVERNCVTPVGSGIQPISLPIIELNPADEEPTSEANGYPPNQQFQSSSIQKDQCPEMKVMFNSLNPVLQKRRTFHKISHDVGTPGSEGTKRETDLSVYHGNMDHSGHCSNKQTVRPSLFLDPEMAKTWHGADSNKWSQYYSPRVMTTMRQSPSEGDGQKTMASDLNKSEPDFQQRSQTLPTKNLLDEMHKKFCADQYVNSAHAHTDKDLVLLRLKTPSQVRNSQLRSSQVKRSASLNIRMGTSSSSSASSEVSPLLSRATGRLNIKTCPDAKYSSRPNRIRAVTPDRLTIDTSQAQNSRKEDAEIEAVEACRWLKETGFPQYAQMYDDGQFPVDIDSVEKDHDFLDKEDIESLFRRLNTLNKCAIMKITTPTKKEAEDSDEEDQCALSDKWKYQRSSKRWSKIGTEDAHSILNSALSHDSLLAGQNSSSETGDSPVMDSKMQHLHPDDFTLRKTSTPVDANATHGLSPKVIRRAASEKIKGAKSFLKRMESIKSSKKNRKGPKTITEISSPVIADSEHMQAKIKHLNCKEISPLIENGHSFVSNASDESGLQSFSDTSANASRLTADTDNSGRVLPPDSISSPAVAAEKTADSSVYHTADTSLSDSDISAQLSSLNGALGLSPDGGLSDSDLELSDSVFLPGKFPHHLDDLFFSKDSQTLRPRSFSEQRSDSASRTMRRVSHDPRHKTHRVSIYDNVPIEEDLSVAQEELDIILSELFQNINGLNRAINGEDAELLEPPCTGSFEEITSRSDSHTPTPQHSTTTANITHHRDQDNETEVISGTLSSPDISDHELPTEELSHDDSSEQIERRERRDSGVGSSLTRTSSDRRKYRIRWHSFQKSHRPSSENRNLQICNLSAGQILMLRKLSLLKLTALIEKYSQNRSSWIFTVPRFMKRHKVPDYSDKNVFGVPFTVMLQRTGQALPQCMLHAMRYLRRTASDALGIFRKSGVRSRIQKLRSELEAHPESVDFEDIQAYDVADLFKQYFRELPECLLSNKLSDIFISLFLYVPADLRVDAMQAAVVLMPDENRDVLQSLLLFLSDIAKLADEHQMTASNLAVCFAPSLFNMGGARNASQTPSPRRNRKNPGIPDARELLEQKAAHECLTMMIQECKKLFVVPAAMLSKCRCWHSDPVTLDQLNSGPSDEGQGYKTYIESCIQGLLKESRDKFRGWVSVPIAGDVDLAYRKVGDGHPLRLWKCSVEVEAPPSEVLNRVLHERQIWDEDLLQWQTVEKLDNTTEIYQFVRNTMAPHPTRDYCVLRSWQTDLPKGACVLISMSIEHSRAELLGGIRGVELASRYLIEPSGTGHSRLIHLSRVDVRGHSPDWYKKVYGHISVNFMHKIRASFKQNADGPETKV